MNLFFKLAIPFHLVSKSFSVQNFPAVYIKTKYQDKFQTVLCYEGFIDTTKVLGLIQSVLLACEAEIAQAAEINAVRALQSEQDAAYLKSLEIDKEKLRKKFSSQSEENIKEDHINKEQFIAEPTSTSEKSNTLKERTSRAILEVESEPPAGSTDVYLLQFLFPDGTRKVRSFNPESTTKVKHFFT